VVLFFGLLARVFSLALVFLLALNQLPWPHGGSMHLLIGMGVPSYVCLLCLCLLSFAWLFLIWYGSDAALVTMLKGGLLPHSGWFTRKGHCPAYLICVSSYCTPYCTGIWCHIPSCPLVPYSPFHWLWLILSKKP
jgi:hypothetical protein